MAIVRKFTDRCLPYVIAVWLIAHAVLDSLNYVPHADAGFGTLLASIAAAIYSSFRIAFAREKRVRIAHIVLLIVALLCAWYANQLPFCPICDGVDSPLMRWLFPEWLKEGTPLQ